MNDKSTFATYKIRNEYEYAERMRYETRDGLKQMFTDVPATDTPNTKTVEVNPFVIVPRMCLVCRKTFSTTHPSQKTCGGECSVILGKQKTKIRNRKAAQ